MINIRLKTIGDMVLENSFVLDVGTDHAYLPIYLSKEKKCKGIYASDISENALEFAKKNISKYDIKNIKLFCTDGLKNIPTDYDTLIISGMGTSNIINILQHDYLPKNIILSSNNDYYKLRKYLNNIGYKIVVEKVVCEKNKYYDIISYAKGKEKLNKKELYYGKSHDKKYYSYLLDKYLIISKKGSLKHKIEMKFKIYLLKKYIKEKI